MQNKWYWTFKNILFGPLLRVYNRPSITGLDNIPASGGVILASNHQAVMDSFYLPLLCPRQIQFPAKQEYFIGEGFVGKLQKWFFTSVGQIPIDRSSGDTAQAAMEAGKKVVENGDVFGIYPEGTRSPDGRIYRGKTGVARIAFATGAPVVPVAMIGSRNANPIGSWVPRPAKVRINVGAPIDPLKFARDRGIDPESYETLRAFTDHVMHTLADLAGKPYVDVYAAEVKKSLEAGLGYPPNALPE
ncbi:1-acyl-sn-glycerol-3-phosphate acyltransferase [Corynebacterium hindlerae]|uniref:1-acyl-sn-glycerol-3-phosphate acyltransferase n=1 Tax=Corynebacterium hindlerae TaxID=699041 RepID=A0A7G5FEF8_9CORY|nr:lysophospholipid acyltransferase family protein [Corynebacterium hindlerae]QMV84999.1 1-acyl-sn-glycerol-3-phosphate acyltransferase [Corynebacterium hindlerae]QTH59105.1 1-acyl-sn-glycerol-3-phosphate acyltransferase [Corynebacterium hindlerae]